VAVTGNGADPRFADLAARLVRFCWDERNNDTVKMHTVAEALAAARAVPPGPGPVVVSDFGDAPGGGGYGDATAVLRALLENPVAGAVFASIADPVAAEAARVAGVGAEVALSLGGHVAPAHGGGPIEAVFRVLALSDGKFTHEGPYTPGQMGQFGPSALLECHGIQVIVTTWQRNILDLQQLRIFGIDPTAPPLIAIKCMDAFRAAFAPIARAAIACESGGVSSRVHTSLTWTKVRRPVWPLDPDAAVEAAAGWV
jgi:microcystin degradation protein MlrC